MTTESITTMNDMSLFIVIHDFEQLKLDIDEILHD